MIKLILSIVVLGLVMAAMAVGVIFSNKPIKGSCGGMGALGIDTACEICGGDTVKCETEQEQQSNKNNIEKLSYDASIKQSKP